ncbi:MAG: hypothetical protein IJQ50_05530 [Clostridia bacterium]|nr:hypothetical protein [Clostridia bacterium]
MSYQIYYDRAYIRVDDKFVPIVNDGSNNCWEYSIFARRDVPEKSWNIMNYKRRSQVLFTADEIREIAKDYEEVSRSSGTCFKSRNRAFGRGEFERWIINGMKRAYTIEEYVAMGNSPYILDYSKDMDEWKEYPFKTTDEFKKLLKELKGSKNLNVAFEDNRSVNKPFITPKTSKIKDADKYYVLKGFLWSTAYFCSIRKRSITYCAIPSGYGVKAFPTENAANRYLEKYGDRLKRFNFKPELYCKTAAI